MCFVFYIILQVLLPLKKLKILPSDLLTNHFSVINGIFVVYSVHSLTHIHWVPAGCKGFGLCLLIFLDQDTSLVKYLSANFVCVKFSSIFIFRWSFKALCSSLLPTELMFYVLPILAATALTNLWVANEN